ncbi:DeoR family transcriptional regulator [Staphylococcus agnetis]|uniref:helix-turn-helix transcriptional regulator n=1 Tax=Staphylococcus agnetis TaxID=985762 RepID=UPI000E0620D5|nr:HTH domain-containing protein [Staphylococcus agnetis]SUK08293.1 DeoR family transcriptional regulator [Staphylococcus agnetis]
MNKETRQSKIIQLIQKQNQISAVELARKLQVSKRTILRDIQELEAKGVQILAHAGKNGGYKIQSRPQNIKLDLTDDEVMALYLILNERIHQTSLPFKNEIHQLIQKLKRQPNTALRRQLKELDQYIIFEDDTHTTLPPLFKNILIYCHERKVMGLYFHPSVQQRQQFANVVFIGLLCKNAEWKAVIYHIGGDYTEIIDISSIDDIDYSFHKSIQTNDITIANYRDYLQHNA